MLMGPEFIVLSFFMVKHYLIDYALQMRYMFKDKHVYGAEGGLSHAGLHGLGTFGVLIAFVGLFPAAMFALLDAVIHYHVDYIKSSTNHKNPVSPATQQYWIMHGLDQAAHFFTYVLICWLIYR
jgi:hypothetical protein